MKRRTSLFLVLMMLMSLWGCHEGTPSDTTSTPAATTTVAPTTTVTPTSTACSHVYEATVTAPTCGQEGYTTYTCDCGDSYISDEVEALSHDHQESSRTEPTQKEDGCITYTCVHCGDTYETVLYATGSEGLEMHLLGDGTYAVDDLGSCTDTDIVIPAYYNGHLVTRIMDYAFFHDTEITSIRIPNTVTQIGTRAFEGCTSLQQITIPASVAYIGKRAFYKCTVLETVYYHSAFSYYGQYEEPLFKLPSIKKMVFGGSKVPWVICAGAENLEEVIIEESVTVIDSSAFGNCSKLTKIQYCGTLAQWDAVNKYGLWDVLSGDCKIYCTDGEANRVNDEASSACSHEYVSEITVAATCEVDGIVTNRCVLCGRTEEEAIEALGHDFQSGSCSHCGAAEAGYRGLTTGSWMLAGLREDGTELEIITMTFRKDGTGSISVEHVPLSNWDEAQQLVAAGGYGILEFEGKPYLFAGSYVYSRTFRYSVKETAIVCDLGDGSLQLTRTAVNQLTVARNCALFIDPSFTYAVNTVGVFTCTHNYEGIVAKVATCQQTGSLEYTCTVCGDSYSQEYTADHSYENGVCTICGFAAPYCTLSQGTWVSESLYSSDTRLNVFELSMQSKGAWGYTLWVSEYYANGAQEDGYNKFAPFNFETYVYQEKLYSDIFLTSVPWLVNITEDGDTVSMEIGIALGDDGAPPYHTYTTVTLQRIGNNQFVVTESEFMFGLFHEGAVLTCYDFESQS